MNTKHFLLLFTFTFFLPFPLYAETNLLLTPLPVKNFDAQATRLFISKLSAEFKKRKIDAVAEKTLPPASTGESASFLAEALDRGRDEQLNFRDEKAIAVVTEALASLGRKTPALADLAGLADAYLFLAYCHKNRGDAEGMRQNLLEAARLNPGLTPNEMYFPPSLSAEFEKAKDEVWSAGKFGRLTIETSPSGARVYVNGAFKGVSPLRLDRYPVGEHHVLAVGNEGEAYKKIVIREDGIPTLRLKLTDKSDGREKGDIVFFPLKDFTAQKKWLADRLKDSRFEKAVGIGISHRGEKAQMVLNAVGFEGWRPSVLDCPPEAEEKLVSEIVGRLESF